jgi:membrane dipeptidase
MIQVQTWRAAEGVAAAGAAGEGSANPAPHPVRLRLSLLPLLGALALPAAAQTPDADLVARARAIHDRVITLDTHVDISAANFRVGERNYADRLETQVSIPRMEEGGLDAAFLIVYVGQDQDFTPEAYARAHGQAMEKFEAIHRLAKEIAPQRVGLALTPADVLRISREGKKAILIGVENGYPLGEDLGNIRRFAELGARYLSLAHNGHSQFSDSNTGERDGQWKWNGLSPLGEQAIGELNRWGVMIDISHPSKAAMLRMLALSKAPVIASHSGVRALANHSRNLDDEQLQALKRNGGVVQLVAFNSYVKTPPPDDPERVRAVAALRQEFGLTGGGQGGLARLDSTRRAAYMERMQELNRRHPPPPRATVKDFVDHIDYAVKLIGIEHVGISSDFDGGGGVDGWSNASETFNVTLELVRRGYTEEQIAKIWSGNLLRVMGEVQRIGTELRR